MTFELGLARAASLIETCLDDLLKENGLSGEAPAEETARLIAAMRHAVLAGGKRLRPYLVMESASLFGVPSEAAAGPAAAVELVHCYSLVHDDLPAMDNDEMRRGRPTVWKAYDEWTAILAGDALLTLAFEVLARPSTHPDPAIRVALIDALARAAGAAGMVGGQALDLLADKLARPKAPTADHIRTLQSMKTGALLTYACEAGAILGDASPGDRLALKRFGAALGLAFQIADDLLDVEGDAATLGKAVAKDANANKATLVSLLGIEEARNALAASEELGLRQLEQYGARADGLRDAMRFTIARRS